MAIHPICDKCKKELLDFGAILLSPPDENDKVMEILKSYLPSPKGLGLRRIFETDF